MERDTERMASPDRTSRFGCALLHYAPQQKEERGMRLHDRDTLTIKSRGKSRGWLSRWRERSGIDKKKREKSVTAPSTDDQKRQAGEVHHILRQKGTLGLWNIHSFQQELQPLYYRAEQSPEDWQGSTTSLKHTLLKIKHTHKFLINSSWRVEGCDHMFAGVCENQGIRLPLPPVKKWAKPTTVTMTHKKPQVFRLLACM